MPTISYTLARDDAEIELEIDYTVAPFDPGTPPSLSYPGDPPSGGEIEDIAIFGPDGAEFTPTADELQQIEAHIYKTHDYSEDDYYD